MTINKPADVILAGRVRRWHQNPRMSHCNENLAEHQWLTVTILLILEPDVSREEIIAALYHDVGELHMGDLAYPIKRKYPELADRHAALEAHERKEMVRCAAWSSPTVAAADRIAGALCMEMEGAEVSPDEWGEVTDTLTYEQRDRLIKLLAGLESWSW